MKATVSDLSHIRESNLNDIQSSHFGEIFYS